MRILYLSDLHGRTKAYFEALERAKAAGAQAIINGGDLYPLGRNLFEVQRSFLEGFFVEFLDLCHKDGITFLATLGNMDLRGLDDIFRRILREVPGAFSLLEESANVGGYTFIGSAMTTDGPFSLKDRCLLDTSLSKVTRTSGPALLSDRQGIHMVPDWHQRITELPTLAEHLQGLPRAENPEKTLYVIHQPPYGTGLGIISSGADVGSHAVADFLVESGALLALHGHIHESPFSGGIWQSRLGRTICLQPGQLSGNGCVTVTIDLETLHFDRRC